MAEGRGRSSRKEKQPLIRKGVSAKARMEQAYLSSYVGGGAPAVKP